MNKTIGFIGQGWIGKHYADDFDARGYKTVRYALEEQYKQNKGAIKDCQIVFIAVPTPTTRDGFCYEPVRNALSCLADGATAVIKSTILPGITKTLQAEFPKLFVLHSPEFLREASAAHDAANPDRNLIGITEETPEYIEKAEAVMAVLPKAKYCQIMPALEAELVKYVGNCFLYSKVVMMNIFHDVVTKAGGSWETVREALVHDERIGSSHTQPVHQSGRGAGGHCFIKDFEAFRRFYEELHGTDAASTMLETMINYNNSLLIKSKKDLDLLEGVYGAEVIQTLQKGE